MKISEKSWHYKYIMKFYKYFSHYMPKSLCSYMFHLTFALTAHLAMLLFLLFAILMIIYLPKLLFIIPALGLFILLIFGISKVSKSENMFIQWLKAKKAKVCPIIEYKE